MRNAPARTHARPTETIHYYCMVRICGRAAAASGNRVSAVRGRCGRPAGTSVQHNGLTDAHARRYVSRSLQGGGDGLRVETEKLRRKRSYSAPQARSPTDRRSREKFRSGPRSDVAHAERRRYTCNVFQTSSSDACDRSALSVTIVARG